MKRPEVTALRHTELFGCLTAEELADIAKRAAELHFNKGRNAISLGGARQGAFCGCEWPDTGLPAEAEGREQVMHVDTAGSVVAEVAVFDGGPYPASAMSEVDVDVLFIDKHDVHDFCRKYPALALQALKLMAQRVRKHAQLVESLCFHEVGQRLAFFLLTRAQYAGTPLQDRAAFHLPLSHHEIAIRIGSVRDVVARAFARLKHDGLITAEGHEVTIPNVRALKLYADAGACGPPS